MPDNPSPGPAWKNQGAAPSKGEAAVPAWKKEAGGPAPGGPRAWQSQPPAPAPRPTSKLTKLVIALTLVGALAGAIVALLPFLRALNPASLIVLGASYDVNLSLPHNAHGWQGLNDLAEVAGRGREQFEMRVAFPEGEPVEVTDEASWQKQWKAATSANVNAKTVLLHLALHGGADSEGAYLFLNEPRLKQRIYVKDLLDDIAKSWPKKNVVLILEPGPLDAHWHSGMLDNQFVRTLKAAVDAAKKQDQLLVLCGCDEDQVCWSSDEWRRTIFAHYLAEGLQGAAAGADRRVTVGELFNYVSDRVAKWANTNRGVKQTPILLGSGARDTELTQVKESYTERPRQDAPGLSAFKPSDDLSSAWKQCTKLGSEVHPAAYTPQQWRRYRDALVRWEQLERAGDPTRAADELQKLCERLAKEMGRGVRVSAGEREITRALPLPGVLGITEKWGRDELHSRLLLLWNASSGEKRRKTFQELMKWSEAGPEESKLLYVALCRELLGFLASSATVERSEDVTAKAKDLVRFLEEEFQLPRPAELHFLVMLNDGLDPKTLPPVEDLKQSLEVRLLAEQAALAAPQGTAAGPSYSEIVQPFIRARIEAADGQRRLAEDWLFGAGAKEWARARELRAKALAGYKKALDDAAVVSQAVDARDRGLADLPYFAAWLGKRQAQRNPDEAAVLRKLTVQVEELSQNIGDLTWCLTQPKLVDGFREPFNSDRKREARTPKDFMDQLAAGIAERHAGLRGEFARHCNGLKQVDHQERWHELEAALAAPLIDDTSLRTHLLEASHRLSQKLHQSDRPFAEADRPPPDPDRAERQKELALAALVANSEDKHPVGLHAKASAPQLAGKIGAYWMQVPERIDKQVKASDLAPDLDEAALKMRDAEFLCRLLPGGMDVAPLAPPASMRRLRLHNLLVSQAQRVKDDHWYDENRSPYYVPAAQAYAQLALDLAAGDGKNEALAAARRAKTEQFAKALVPGDLKVAPPVNLDWTSELKFPLTWTLDAEQGVPRGVPMYWFQTKDGLGSKFADASPRTAVDDWEKQKTKPLLHVLTDAGQTEVNAVALFRGQRALRPVQARVWPPQTVVEHFPARKSGVAFRMARDLDYGAICFVIDCSGSMRSEVKGTNKQRREHAIEALDKTLEIIPDNTFVSVLAFQTPAGKNNPEYKLVYVPQRWKARDRGEVVRDLYKLDFNEYSPLAEALVQGLKQGFDDKNYHGSKLIVALTDGDDNFTFGKYLDKDRTPPTTLAQHAEEVRRYVSKRFQDRGTAVHVVVFNDEQADDTVKTEIGRARLQFKDTVEKDIYPPGEFHHVPEPGQLAKNLELAIRPLVRLQRGMLPVPGIPERFPAERELDWKVLPPGDYTVSLPQRRPQDIRLHPGDWMILTLKRDPAKRELYFERSLVAEEETGPHIPTANKAGWVATMLQNQDMRKTDMVRQLIALEDDTKGADLLQQVPPGFVWLEVTPDDRPLRRLTWRRDYTYPAPALRAEALGWPSQGARLVKAGAGVWWTGTPYPENKAYAMRLKRNPGRTLLDDFVTNSAANVGGAAIRIEEVVEERRPVRKAPEAAPFEQPCLVVRVHLDNKKPVFVQLISADPSLCEEHRYYAGADRYTAVFWNVPDLGTAPFSLNIISLEDFKAAAEPALFRQLVPGTFPGPAPVPVAGAP